MSKQDDSSQIAIRAVTECETERDRLQSHIVESPFRWQDLDQRLIAPKTSDIAEEMQKRAADAERRIGFEAAQTGNSAGYLPRFFDFHEQLVDQWAEKLYAAHCEAWTQQNGSLSAAFIRAVRDHSIAQLMAARKSSVYAQVCMRGTRISEQPNSTAMGEWIRRMDRLAARWNRRLEADAVAAEYRVTKALQGSPSNLIDSHGWIPKSQLRSRKRICGEVSASYFRHLLMKN